MYNEFFGFTHTPFDIVPNPDFLFLSERHKIALDHLEYGLMSGASFILLTGDIGTGKTTLVREVLRRFIPRDTEVALIFQTNITSEQLLNMLLTEFELPTHPGDKAGALDELNQFLVDRYSMNRHVLIVVDEAQNLAPDALEELRMLSNLQSDERMLLQVILVGQPELKKKLLDPRLAQFAQRIAVNYHLTPLSLEEAESYIVHRLTLCGGRPDIFTPEAMARVHEASGGIPRSINLLCASALLYAYADQKKQVSEDHVSQAVVDKDGLGGTARRPRVSMPEPVAAAAPAQPLDLAPYAVQAPAPAPAAQPAPQYSPQFEPDLELIPGLAAPAPAPAAPQAALVQVAETNQRLSAMEQGLRSLLDAFNSYEDELTRRIEGIRLDGRKTSSQLAERCQRLEQAMGAGAPSPASDRQTAAPAVPAAPAAAQAVSPGLPGSAPAQTPPGQRAEPRPEPKAQPAPDFPEELDLTIPPFA